MLVGDAVATLQAALDGPVGLQLEGLVAGDPADEVTSIVVCSVPSMKILQRASATGTNLILRDGHPFQLYDSVWSTQIPKPESVLAAPVTVAKRAFISEHCLNILRIRTTWERKNPASASRAFAEQLGFGPAEPRADDAVCAVPQGQRASPCRFPSTQEASIVCGVVGRPPTPATHVAIKACMLTSIALSNILRDPAIDIVIAGDAAEWGATPYMQDVVAMGRRAALLLTGFDAPMAPQSAHIAA